MSDINHLIELLREEAYYVSTPEPAARILSTAADALAEYTASTS